MSDKKWLQIAIFAAKPQLGRVYPNPAVGAVIVKNNQLLSKGVTGDKGTPHAEVDAINKLNKDQLNGATLYATLEPCNHTGKNPSCCELIIKSGIKKVVIGCIDVNPLVRGLGIKALSNAGIEVNLLNHPDAKELHKMFFQFISYKIPYLTCKIATSLDGKIALASKDSKWITSEISRNYVHLLRSRHDAILTGVGTIISDDPILNCRIKGYEQNRLVIILDRNLDIPCSCNIINNKLDREIWVYTISKNEKKIAALSAKGVKVISLALDDYNDPLNILRDIGVRGVTSVFLEAGKLITKFIKSDLINHLIIFRGTKFFGQDSFDMCGALEITDIAKAKKYKLLKVKNINNIDVIEEYIQSKI